MKTDIISLAVVAAAAFAGLTSCSDTWTNDLAEEEKGTLNTASILASVNTYEAEKEDAQGAKAPESRAVTDLSPFIVEVVKSDGSKVASWTYATMPPAPTFAVGTYTVRVKSHNPQPVEWEKPYYAGEQQFQIKANDVTDVDPIVCTLANVRVSIEVTEALKKASAGDVKITFTGEPGVDLEFAPDETRSGYFAYTEGLSTMKVHFEGTVSGAREDFTHVLKDIQPGQHRLVKFALRINPNPPADETGNIEIPEGEGVMVDCGVTTYEVDGTVSSKEDVIDDSGRPGQEEGGDDPKPDDPDDKAITFSSSTLDLEGANMAEEFGEEEGLKPAVVDIHSENGVKSLKVKIISDFLTEDMLSGIGLTSQFDLADPGEYAEGLAGIGFPSADEVNGAHDLQFNITKFIPLIFEEGDHKFEITVTDSKGLVKTMVLLIRV
jgi:hypothetical protein